MIIPTGRCSTPWFLKLIPIQGKACRLNNLRHLASPLYIREDFVRLVESRPELGVEILLKLSELLVGRIRHANEDVVRLTTALSIALSK